MTDMGLRDRPTLDTCRSDLGLIDVLTTIRGLIEEMRRDGREVPQHALEYTVTLLQLSNLLDWTVTVNDERWRVTSFNRALKTIEVAPA